METEVGEYIRHGDYSLAIRRIMDLALDSQNPELVSRSIQLSRDFRNKTGQEDMVHWPAEFQQASNALLDALANWGSATAQPGILLLQAEAVSKTYRSGSFSLKPISLDLYSGQVIGVVGENGNGKTTLLRCLSAQLAIDSGTIRYAEMSKTDYYTVKSRIAFIPQRIPKWYGRLKDNLHFSAAIAGVRGEKNERLVEFMLERFGLSEYANLSWDKISSGYRTRFEIARVLLQQPHVLILDEPLANLDIHAQQTLLTDLRFLAKSATHRMAVILTSQQLHEVEKTADTVLLIRKGECIFQTGQNDLRELGFALELETDAPRELVMQALATLEAQVQFNGGFFTVVSYRHNAQEILKQLVLSGIRIAYCRDISSSTKRLF